MSISRDKPEPAPPKSPVPAVSPEPAVSPARSLKPVDAAQAQLAHELANLLDGSLRNVGLVMSSLNDPMKSLPGNGEDDDLVSRLDAANRAMQQMALLIRRWMGGPAGAAALHHQHGTLREIVDSAVRLLAPVASARRIAIRTDLAPAVIDLPAGPLYPVIANAIRNSIDAIGECAANDPDGGGTIEIVARRVDNRIEVSVRDDGPGVSPAIFDDRGGFKPGVSTKQSGGHGFGLALAHDITRTLGGSIELRNRTPRGAELVLWYPMVKAAEE